MHVQPGADFRRFFEAAPGIHLVLAADAAFTMIAASDGRLRATMTRREDTIGRPLFEVFPDNPADPAASGVVNLRASLERVIATAAPDRMTVQRYDIRRPDGSFEERYWSPLNTPVTGSDGAVAYIIHTVEDVTERMAEQRRAAAALDETEQRLRLALAASGSVGTWTWDVPCDRLTVDAHFARMFSVEPAAAAAGAPVARFFGAIHPDDRPRVEAEIAGAVAIGGDYESEYRILRPDGSVRWVHARGRCEHDAAGAPTRFPGALVDITERKRIEEHRELLLAELNHRVKNTLASVLSIANQTLAGAPSLDAFGDAYRARVMALAQAHDQLSKGEWQGAALAEVIRAELRPYLGTGSDRLVLDGPPVQLPPRLTLALGMAFHELTTNAAKYGALSVPGGRIAVSWSLPGSDHHDRVLALEWSESGGPPVGMPRRRGFGSKLIERGLAHEFDGVVALAFDPKGVRCTIEILLRREETGEGRPRG